ncbi:nuclear transport factor 2 family protein [Hyphococcus lacteus]|uniref:Nuclear transport factor 2 family protein n=1 Tax=Hyphococcus lacteus TaxID=3143536 RepID=A0ABV3Z0D4_9PROT
MSENIDLVKSVLRAYVNDDRDEIERRIADQFSFTSPYDNQIDRTSYMERCWPNHEATKAIDFIRFFENGDDVVTSYEVTLLSGRKFRNTEILSVQNGKISAIEVFFGWDLPHPATNGKSIDIAAEE